MVGSSKIDLQPWLTILIPTVVVVYGLIKFLHAAIKTRRFYRGAPGLHHPIWGSLKAVGAYMKDDRHFDYHAVAIWKDLGKPPFYFIDTWPVVRPCTVIVCDPELAETVNRATPNRPYDALHAVIGPRSILSATGEDWKMLRRRYNPGFSGRHLQRFLPEIVRETEVFVSRLEGSVGQVVTLRDLTTALTIDIISCVTFGHSLNAQTSDSTLTSSFAGLLDWQFEQERQDPRHHFNILRPLMQRYYGYRLDRAIDREIQRSLVEEANSTRRSIINLTFTPDHHKVHRDDPLGTGSSSSSMSKKTPATPPTSSPSAYSQSFLLESRDQIKTFMFAGHDTTSSLLQWLYYELSTHPAILLKLRTEHASLFHPTSPRDPPPSSPSSSSSFFKDIMQDPSSYHARVSHLLTTEPDSILTSMPYTVACIKETLRVHNIASGSRLIPPAPAATAPLQATDPLTGTVWPFAGHVVYTPSLIYHSDDRWYGDDVDLFRPERWLDSDSDSDYDPDSDSDCDDRGKENENENENKKNRNNNKKRKRKRKEIPPIAFQPFSRGPGACIGQELVWLEAKVIVALTVMRFDLYKVFDDDNTKYDKYDKYNKYNKYQNREKEVYNIRRITGKPKDGMRMRVERWAEHQEPELESELESELEPGGRRSGSV